MTDCLDEAAVRARLSREGRRPERWSNGPHTVYSLHEHPYGKVLVVVAGSLTVTMDDGTRIVHMSPGDRLNLPPRTPHSALVGPDGVVCLEAHLESLSVGS